MNLSNDNITTISLSHISNFNDFKDKKAYEVLIPLELGYPRSNLKFKLYEIPVQDARGQDLNKFNLIDQGFQFLQCPSLRYLTADNIRRESGQRELEVYLERLAATLKETLQAEKVILYDWRVSGESRKNKLVTHLDPSCAVTQEVRSAPSQTSQVRIDRCYFLLPLMCMQVSSRNQHYERLRTKQK